MRTVAPLMGKLSKCAQEKNKNFKKSALLTERKEESMRRKSQCKGRGRSRRALESLGRAVNGIEPTTRAREKCTDCGNESAATAQNHCQ